MKEQKVGLHHIILFASFSVHAISLVIFSLLPPPPAPLFHLVVYSIFLLQSRLSYHYLSSIYTLRIYILKQR